MKISLKIFKDCRTFECCRIYTLYSIHIVRFIVRSLDSNCWLSTNVSLLLLKAAHLLVSHIFFLLFFLLSKTLAPGQTVTLVTQSVVTKETVISKLEMPSSLLLEVPALADFNRAWTELTEWLSLLDRVIKSQRVMVGDLEDINEMINKQKVWIKTISRKSVKRFFFRVHIFPWHVPLLYDLPPGFMLPHFLLANTVHVLLWSTEIWSKAWLNCLKES